LGTLSLLAVSGIGVFWPMVRGIRSEAQKREHQEQQLSMTLNQLREQRDARHQRMGAMASVMEDLQEERAALQREIQARENVQQALQRSEEVFHAIVESSPTAKVMIDPFGNIALINAEAERMFGYDRKELIGKPVEILVPHRFRSAHPLHRQQFLETPTTRRMGVGRDLYGLRKDGTEVSVVIGLNPIEAEEGIFVLSAIVDITERQRTEREIRRINAELLGKNEEIQQFVYTVSHDLKSPLVTCKGFIGVAREDLKEGRLDDVDESLIRVEYAADRMGQLIQDLLQLSRIGTIRNEPEEIDVEELVQSAISDLSARVDEASVIVSVQHDLPRVFADRVRLTQVFENLLTNAIKYGCRADRPEIVVEGRADAEEVCFCVRDNGDGIAPQFHERIFGLFERLESDKDGTGVGLAAVARIMDAHGGRVWVESDIGKGAAFWLAFPANPRINASGKK
ncbi:MAG: ATP-binding protein, partial [Planctomycetota bacterium]